MANLTYSLAFLKSLGITYIMPQCGDGKAAFFDDDSDNATLFWLDFYSISAQA